MAKIFLSSTCYDLSPIRSVLDIFLKDTYKFEILNSEKNNFPVKLGVHSHSACIEQVKEADYVILIIGNRRGGTYIGSEKSITNEEYNTALKNNIPVLKFVSKTVKDHLDTYKKNPSGNFSSVVEDTRVFTFLEYIISASTDNWIFPFQEPQDIIDTLKHQFSYFLHLFSNSFKNNTKKSENNSTGEVLIVDLPSNFARILELTESQEIQTSLLNGMKNLYKLLNKILTSEIKTDVKNETLKVIWIMAKYGKFDKDYKSFQLEEAKFKGFTFSMSRGNRVFKQMELFNINIDYTEENDYYDRKEIFVKMHLPNLDDDTESYDISNALEYYSKTLIEKFGDEGFNIFKQADMRIFIA